MTSFFVTLTLPRSMSAEAREPLAEVVTRLAARFSFQGLEDWSVDVKDSRVLGAETEFRDLTRAGRLNPEMRVYFAKKPDAALFARILAHAFADLPVSRARKLAPRDWMKAWRRHYRVQTIVEGKQKLAIVPSWKKAPKHTASVRISPGQAFGTGTHPTTRLCLRLLLRRGKGAPRVLDFGAGTGVLVLAARKLGAKTGVAVESDPVALDQARKNARLNRSKGIRFARKLPSGQFDLVFANVLAPVLLAHRRPLQARVAKGGWIFLSGLLSTEADSFLRAFGAKKFELMDHERDGDWAALALRRRLPI